MTKECVEFQYDDGTYHSETEVCTRANKDGSVVVTDVSQESGYHDVYEVEHEEHYVTHYGDGEVSQDGWYHNDVEYLNNYDQSYDATYHHDFELIA